MRSVHCAMFGIDDAQCALVNPFRCPCPVDIILTGSWKVSTRASFLVRRMDDSKFPRVNLFSLARHILVVVSRTR